MLKWFLHFIIAPLFSYSCAATECEHSPISANQKFELSDAVLSGTVLLVAGTRDKVIDIQIGRVWKGTMLGGAPMITVQRFCKRHPQAIDECTTEPLEEGKDYLFYIRQRKSTNDLFFGFCSAKNFIPLSEAGEEIKVLNDAIADYE
jgi:hypothetical protein